MNYHGLLAGAALWAIIWATRYACIKGEYHWGKTFRGVFLALGVLGIIAALLVNSLLLSAIFAIFGFTNLWGIHEVIEQEERVRKGWFPKKTAKEKSQEGML